MCRIKKSQVWRNTNVKEWSRNYAAAINVDESIVYQDEKEGLEQRRSQLLPISNEASVCICSKGFLQKPFPRIGDSWQQSGALLGHRTRSAIASQQKVADTLYKAGVISSYGRSPTNLGATLATLPRFQTAVGEIEALLYANQRLIYSLAADIDKGEYDTNVSLQAQTVKYLATNNAIRAVEIGLELIGNPGLSRNNPLERHYPDVLCSRIHTPQNDVICLSLGKSALRIKN
ncbi:acyl-CoA dehydrogenase family protein [Scytonema sp. PCC 10023]|uniref:acyl-CoA dehydrogenase family protein n=1 Tax=Scytonema sp. PCC 10023 TaxID=1680591 RepID=UPI0039C7427F